MLQLRAVILNRRPHLTHLCLVMACGTLVAKETQSAEPTRARSTVELERGTLFVPSSFSPGRRQVDLLVHFHGAKASVANGFETARIDGVLLVINYPGLSSAYRRPFEDPVLFDRILESAMASLHRQSLVPRDARWKHVCVSSFSAGFGAVRELLKRPDYFARIDGLLCADSIYAGLVVGSRERRVEPAHMKDFRRYARCAASGEKTFVITHSYLRTPTYASTEETADVIVECIGARRHTVDENGPEGMRIVSRVRKGNFLLLGCEGDDGRSHMQHLKNIGAWLSRLPLTQRAADTPE